MKYKHFFIILCALTISLYPVYNEEHFTLEKDTVSNTYQQTKIGIVKTHNQDDILTSSIWNNVKKSLETGGQLSFIPIKSNQKNFDLKSKSKEQLIEKNILFTLIIFEQNNTFAWKLIDNQQNIVISQKEYTIKKCSSHTIKTICSDIWTQLFGKTTPFDYDLIYVKSDKSKKRKRSSSICRTSPLIFPSALENVLKSNRPIYDLSTFNAFNQTSFVYSEPTTHNVRIMCMNQNGIIYPIINRQGTSNCFSQLTSQSALYVNSGDIYVYQYDSEKQCIIHTPLLHSERTYSNPISIGSNNIAYVKRGHIYKCTLKKNSDSIFLENHKKLISHPSVAPTYCSKTDLLSFCQKSNGYMQICIKDLSTNKEQMLTSSSYDKTDPAFSPCGNYIAYIASKKDTCNRHIEIINIYTRHTLYITSDTYDLSYPCWY